MSEPLPFSSQRDPAPQLPDAILDAAALHLARRDRRATPAEDAAFADWLAADPRHHAAVCHLSAAWASLDALQLPSSAVARKTLSQPQTGPRLIPFPAPRTIWPWAAAAACLALLIGIVAWQAFPTGPANERVAYTTPLGASATHLLPDGTRVRLNTDSSVEFDFTRSERRARLTRGEACFEVAPDPARPFVVEIDRVRVRVVGTVFNLRRHPDHVDLVVAKGRVRLAYGSDAADPGPRAQALLGPGDQASVALAAPGPADPIEVKTLDAAALDRALAWRDGRLVFAATPLSAALAEFARHHAMRVEFADPALASLRIGGAYTSADLDGFLALLEAGFAIRVERPAPGRLRLHRSQPPGS